MQATPPIHEIRKAIKMNKILNRDKRHDPHTEQKFISKNQWDIFERKIKPQFSISKEYKEFILSHNGGSFHECVLDTPALGELIVNKFYPIDENCESSLEIVLENTKEDLNRGFLHIADDPGGNGFLLGINQVNNGEIFYWLHDGTFENGLRTIKIAGSFIQFIESLRKEE